MKYFMCDLCYNVFNGDFMKEPGEDYNPCPIAGCQGDAFEIDEQMVLPIQMLNLKGYNTKFCCSGHALGIGSGGYIQFLNAEEWGYDCTPKGVPTGWYKADNCIKYNFEPEEESSPLKRLETQNRKMIALAKWCEKLPEKEDKY